MTWIYNFLFHISHSDWKLLLLSQCLLFIVAEVEGKLPSAMKEWLAFPHPSPPNKNLECLSLLKFCFFVKVTSQLFCRNQSRFSLHFILPATPYEADWVKRTERPKLHLLLKMDLLTSCQALLLSNRFGISGLAWFSSFINQFICHL